ncbi:MAG: hypothetical protein ACRDTG_28545 [Pseudonocardiaceae bacterium]
MHYYLSRWEGDGQRFPYQPAIGAAAELDGGAWSVIDLRPDPALAAGRALVACSVRAADESGGRYLGDDPAADLPALVRTRVANDLGLSLTKTDLRRVVVELLIDHSREDGTRWRPLRPLTRLRSHAWEIHLGGPWWALPRIAGGSVHFETFTGGDNLSIAAADIDLTWAVVDTGWSVSGNTASLLAESTGTAYARAEHNSDGADTYTEAMLTTKVDSGDPAQFGPCVRFDPTANTNYFACRGQDTSTDFRLRKTTAGTRTNLTSAVTIALDLPELVRVEAEGSTIRGLLAGSTHLTVTDTSIATGRGGIFGFRPDGGTITIDNFEFGDLGGPMIGALGTAVQTDTAHPLGRSKARALGPGAGTEEAQPLGRVKIKVLGTAVEVSIAPPITRSKARSLGTAGETSTAQALSAARAQVLGTAVELCSAPPLGRSKVRLLGTAVELDQALPITPPAAAVMPGRLTATHLPTAVLGVSHTHG